MSKKINRRDFIKTSALVGVATTVMSKILFSSPVTHNRVKLGFIGTGLRGQWLLSLAVKYPDVEIPAICDIDKGMVRSTLKILKGIDKPEPRVYQNGDEDFRNMVARENLNGVIIATPWKWHHPMSIAATMN